jgi:hypothetical protein
MRGEACVSEKVRKKHQIFVALLPEVLEAYGDLISIYLREALAKLAEVDLRELNKLPKDAVKEYYEKARPYRKGVHVHPDVYEKWLRIPYGGLKKKAQYWVNQWLLEKAKELELL